jgi:hypothetical protein
MMASTKNDPHPHLGEDLGQVTATPAASSDRHGSFLPAVAVNRYSRDASKGGVRLLRQRAWKRARLLPLNRIYWDAKMRPADWIALSAIAATVVLTAVTLAFS